MENRVEVHSGEFIMSSNSNKPRTYHEAITRRRFVQAAGGAGMVGITGYTGGEKLQDPVTTEFVADSWRLPGDTQFNQYNPTNWGGQQGWMLFDPFAKYDPNKTDFIPFLVDWSIDETSATLTLREEREWHNGDPVTSADFATKLKLDKYVGDPVWDFLASVSAPDDQTIELELAGKTNPDVLKLNLLSKRLTTKESVHGEFLQKLEDASTDNEENSARNELTNFKWEEPIGNGLFQWGDRSERKITLHLWEDHPVAENVNWDKYSYVFTPDNQSHWEGLIGGELDGVTHTLFMPENVVQQLPDHMVEFLYPNNGGMGLTFNNDHELFGKREVRQAFAYIIDREPVAVKSGGDTKKAVEIPHGTIQELAEEFFPSDVLDKLVAYDGVQKDKAAALLEEAGLTKSGGTWQRPDGGAWQPTLKVQSGASDWVSGLQEIIAQLENFGIQAQMSTVEDSSYWGETLPSSDFEAAMNFWGGGQPHPFFGLRWAFASQTMREFNNFPAEIESPSTLGDPDSDLETINVEEQVEKTAQSSGEETSKLMGELAWVLNQHLSVIPIQEKLEQHFVSTDDWEIPSKDAPVNRIKYPTQWLPRVGKLNARTK